VVERPPMPTKGSIQRADPSRGVHSRLGALSARKVRSDIHGPGECSSNVTGAAPEARAAAIRARHNWFHDVRQATRDRDHSCRRSRRARSPRGIRRIAGRHPALQEAEHLVRLSIHVAGPTGVRGRRLRCTGLAKFSSQGFNVPCRYESCWVPPGGHLEPGGVFGDWEAYSPSGGVSLPAAQFVQVGRLHVWFDRRPARDRCKAMSGTEALSVFVQRRTPKDWYLMDACLRWPTSTTEGLIHRMLASADFLDLP
jgi:hypothetical protein